MIMNFKGAIRWGLRPKRIGILLAKLLLAGTTELAAQTSSYPGACCDALTVPSQALEQGSAAGIYESQPRMKSATGDKAPRLW